MTHPQFAAGGPGPRPLITLTTDFGAGSPYVAAMKGVLLRLHPAVGLVDLSHAIAPQDVRQAALLLADAVPYFPSETIHVVVVDPGVGTSRRLVYVETDEFRALAPDNGVLSLLLQRQPPRQIVELTERRFWRHPVSATFHGRDILAPVAAHLSLGSDPAELGAPRAELLSLPWAQPQRTAGQVQGEILWVDTFGNLISNLTAEHLPGPAARWRVVCRDHVITGLVTTYGDAPRDSLVALFGSSGRLEIAAVEGDAARRLGAGRGDAICASLA